MREFRPITIGLRSDISEKKESRNDKFESTRRYTYPRSYYGSNLPVMAGLSHMGLERMPGGLYQPSPEFLEWIDSALDKTHIKKSGELHPLDFDDSSKSEREFTGLRAYYSRPSSSTDSTTLWENGTVIAKK